jgi:hypothetical protein
MAQKELLPMMTTIKTKTVAFIISHLLYNVSSVYGGDESCIQNFSLKT